MLRPHRQLFAPADLNDPARVLVAMSGCNGATGQTGSQQTPARALFYKTKSGVACLIPCLTLDALAWLKLTEPLILLVRIELERVKGIEPSFRSHGVSI